MLKDIIKELTRINSIIRNYLENKTIEFQDAWTAMEFFNKNKDTEFLINGILSRISTDSKYLKVDLESLDKETAEIVSYYRQDRKLFEDLDMADVCDKHLIPYNQAFNEANAISVSAYKEYKEIDQRLDFPIGYSEEEIQEMWKEHALKKEYSNKCSKHTQEAANNRDNERRRIAPLAGFKIGALVMLVSSINDIAQAAQQDLSEKVASTNE